MMMCARVPESSSDLNMRRLPTPCLEHPTLQNLASKKLMAVNEAVIRKAYLRQSKVRHPDKGGPKEAFQRLVNAYARLRAQGTTSETSSNDEDVSREESYDREYDEEYWYEEHFSFFGRDWTTL